MNKRTKTEPTVENLAAYHHGGCVELYDGTWWILNKEARKKLNAYIVELAKDKKNIEEL